MNPHVDSNPNTNWNNNAIQFPRLIAELRAIGGFSMQCIEEVAVNMDLDYSQVHELIDRAVHQWDEIKRATFNPQP